VAVEALIGYGHAPADVWNYTPRQLHAFQRIAARRERHEAANRLVLDAMAARGDPKTLEKRVKAMTGD